MIKAALVKMESRSDRQERCTLYQTYQSLAALQDIQSIYFTSPVTSLLLPLHFFYHFNYHFISHFISHFNYYFAYHFTHHFSYHFTSLTASRKHHLVKIDLTFGAQSLWVLHFTIHIKGLAHVLGPDTSSQYITSHSNIHSWLKTKSLKFTFNLQQSNDSTRSQSHTLFSSSSEGRSRNHCCTTLTYNTTTPAWSFPYNLIC